MTSDSTPTTRTYYPRRWRNGVAALPDGIWPNSTVTTPEAARLLGVSTRTLERHRRAGTGPVQVPGQVFYGRRVRYEAWQLLAWRNRVTGTGPTDLDGTWEAWMDGLTDVGSSRPEPPRKPAGTPKGEDRRDTNRRMRRNIILKMYEAEDQLAQWMYERLRLERG